MRGAETIRIALILLSITGVSAPARTLEVGPGKDLQTINAAARLAKPGDLILIHPGVYREAVRWRGGSLDGPPVTVRGIGSPSPVVDGAGLALSGDKGESRALFQVEGDNFVFENLAFRNARNGQNASGFRFLRSRRTVVRNCAVYWCDMGLMSTGNDDLTVEFSEIAYNGTYRYNGYSHNFYIAGGASVIRGCYIHDATAGQNFKTRGRYTLLVNNYIADAHDGIGGAQSTKEIGIQEGPDSVLPNAHAVLIGNVIVKRGSGDQFIDFGPEKLTPPRNGALYLINNTFIREGPINHAAIRLGHPSQQAFLWNNIVQGFADVSTGFGGANLTGSHNWMGTRTRSEAPLDATVRGSAPDFVDGPARDYRPAPESRLSTGGRTDIRYPDAAGVDQTVDRTSYVPHCRIDRRPSGSTPIGAFDSGATGTGKLLGRVLSANQRPLPGVAITATGPAAASTMTRSDGWFALTGLPPGAYTLTPWWALPIQPAQLRVNERSQSVALFSTPPLFNLTGLLRQWLRTPVIYLEGPASAEVLTDSGQFAANGLPGGAYRIWSTTDNRPFELVLTSDRHLDLNKTPAHSTQKQKP